MTLQIEQALLEQASVEQLSVKRERALDRYVLRETRRTPKTSKLELVCVIHKKSGSNRFSTDIYREPDRFAFFSFLDSKLRPRCFACLRNGSEAICEVRTRAEVRTSEKKKERFFCHILYFSFQNTTLRRLCKALCCELCQLDNWPV